MTDWVRVKTLFGEAVDLDPAQRSAFLAAACGDDGELRADVESLIAAHDTEGVVHLEHPAWEVVGGTDLTFSLDAGSTREGQRVGPYQLIQQIGQGGMGRVYLASRDDEEFQKRVAIKIVKRGMGSDEILRRFRTERQTLAGLDHPNIAKLLDGGTTPDGLPYFVMEYVEGQRIDDYCDAGRLSTRQRLDLFRAVCAGVQYAHQNLVVHRDLKPDNILVTADGIPKLVDFGIAKLLGPDADTEMTRPGGRMMTPGYASPEQVRGAPITTATDVYSLSVLLYELLSGHRPYTIGASGEDLERAICEETPDRPSIAVLRTDRIPQSDGSVREITPADVSRVRDGSPVALRNRLAGDLDTIVLMGMRKEPDRRYASAQQLSDDIRRHLEGLPVTAHRDTVRYRAGKFVRRHTAAVAAAAMLVLSLIAGIAGTAWQARVAAAERDRARLEATKAEQISAFLQDMLSSADPFKQGRDVTVAQSLDEAARRVDTELANQPELQASIRHTIGSTYYALGLYEQADTHLTAALSARRRLLGRENPEVGRTLRVLADVMSEKGDLAAAESMHQEGLTILRKAYGPDHPDTITALRSLGQLRQAQGKDDEAEQIAREALAIARKVYGNEHQEVAESLNNLGVVLGSRGDYAAAEPLHRDAVEIVRKVRGPNHPDLASALSTLASVISGERKYAEANPLFEEALALRRKLFGNEHPSVTWVLYNYAFNLQEKGEYVRAEELAREVLALRGKTLPDGHPMVAGTLQVLGRSLMKQGKVQQAEPLFRESLALRQQTLPPDNWLISSSESVLGECLAAQGRFAQAEPLVVQSYEGLLEKLGAKHERTVEALQRVIALYDAWHKPDKAAAFRTRS